MYGPPHDCKGKAKGRLAGLCRSTRQSGVPDLICTSDEGRHWTKESKNGTRQAVLAGGGSESVAPDRSGWGNGKTTAQACKEAEIVEQTYFRWRKEYGGLQIDQAKRLKELEQENGKLKRLVANLSLDNLVLKDIASGNF